MKNSLLTTLAILALSTAAVSAETIIAPNYTTTSTPSLYPAFTSVTSGGATNTFPGNNTQVSTGLALPGSQAYITATNSSHPASPSYTLTFTFTPSYNALTPSGRQYESIPVLALHTTGGNDNLFELDLVFNSYVNQATLQVNPGIEYGGSTTGTPQDYTVNGLNSLNNTYTVTDVITFSSDLATDTGTVENDGAIYQAGSTTPVFSFDDVTTGHTFNDSSTEDSFQPGTNPLSLSLGIISANVDSGFFATGSKVTFSGVNVTSPVPEPSTYALLLGGLGLLALVARRRSTI